MDKIPKRDLGFLEFVSSKIYREGSGWWQLDQIVNEYNSESSIKFNLEDVRQFAALYKNKYFTVSPQSDLKIFPIPEIRQAIDNYGSISGLLAFKRQEERKVEFKKSLIVYITSIIALASLIVNISTCTHKDKLTTKIEFLKKELHKSDSTNLKKDTLIYDLKKQLLSDPIKIKH